MEGESEGDTNRLRRQGPKVNHKVKNESQLMRSWILDLGSWIQELRTDGEEVRFH